jgi:ferredoxin-type protein NapH
MKNENEWDISFKTLKGPLILLAIFLGIGIWRGITAHILYLFNFGYIGLAIAAGSFLNDALPRKHKQWGRRIAQILVASYLLGFIGIAYRENMQIEGFFFYLLMGVFAGATLHYFIAKVVGTFILNRGWCGWACWTAMVLDLLPWRKPQNGRVRHLGAIRYVHFALSLGLVLFVWYGLGERELFAKKTMAELYWLGAGNALYYIVGITLAAVLKDNRAFCKYVCPIPVLQKIGARFALWRMEIDPDKCIDCGLCEKNCPMDIKLLDYKEAGQRILSTECIQCQTCANVCPEGAISSSLNQFDIVREERLRYRGE